ncbi:hypothetical protein CpCAPGE03_0439 [Corynebacterium pseudotuberculosis]|nr:Hypothetical protein Cp267_0426 [Corynebacterium pseudotuberculosis 267]AKC73170.1 Hypothetical protein Cp226_0428 [Corynebacterium pseudotuberculosis]AUY59839.1 Hypothetical protein BFG00_0451 [Corynebacterium pseudotuberculosis]QDL44537.1 hypothetical protein CpCAPGE03_0439 [Corynebacterium pseudotuberculosis]
MVNHCATVIFPTNNYLYFSGIFSANSPKMPYRKPSGAPFQP